MDPLPPINKIFSYVAQQERQFSVPDSLAEVNATIMNSTCNFYGRAGHTKSTCYCKHGFPAKNGKSTSNHGKACSHGGKNGHTIDTCYKKHGFPPGHRFSNNKSASANSVLTTEVKANEKDVSTFTKHQETRFTPQQYQALLALIQ